MRFRLTPSGLTMDRVRSSAIAKSFLETGGENSQPTRLQTSRAVYLGISVGGNLRGAPDVRRKCRFRKGFGRALPGRVARRRAPSPARVVGGPPKPWRPDGATYVGAPNPARVDGH